MPRLIIAILFFVSTSSAESWKFLVEKDGIKVFSKSVPDSKIKAIKAECILNANSSQVVSFLLDVKAAEKWVYHTKSCDLLRKVSQTELFYYSEVSLPWPLENRDFVAHVKVTRDPLTEVITINSPVVSGFVPVKNGLVRINQGKGSWTITPLNKEQVRIEYILLVDPGGIIPAWAVNMFASQGPIECFKNLRRDIQHSKYKNAASLF